MNWQPISEYKCENYERGEDVILFDAVEGIKPGYGNRYCYDEDYPDTEFQTYGCCGYALKNVTHFMAMPVAPPKKEVTLEKISAGLPNN